MSEEGQVCSAAPGIQGTRGELSRALRAGMLKRFCRLLQHGYEQGGWDRGGGVCNKGL